MNPLSIPLLRGWLRQKNLLGDDTTTCTITYMTPCGRYLSSLSELQRYLLVYTHSQLSVDMFTFERYLSINKQFDIVPSFVLTDDITRGLEKRAAISCVNTVDRLKPDPKIRYMAQFSSPLVSSSLQQGLLDCCDCKNDCADVEKCACWLRTRYSAEQLAASLSHDQVMPNRLIRI